MDMDSFTSQCTLCSRKHSEATPVVFLLNPPSTDYLLTTDHTHEICKLSKILDEKATFPNISRPRKKGVSVFLKLFLFCKVQTTQTLQVLNSKQPRSPDLVSCVQEQRCRLKNGGVCASSLGGTCCRGGGGGARSCSCVNTLPLAADLMLEPETDINANCVYLFYFFYGGGGGGIFFLSLKLKNLLQTGSKHIKALKKEEKEEEKMCFIMMKHAKCSG